MGGKAIPCPGGTWCPKANLIWVNESESDRRNAHLVRPQLSHRDLAEGATSYFRNWHVAHVQPIASRGLVPAEKR